jgi:hypothetical protein
MDLKETIREYGLNTTVLGYGPMGGTYEQSNMRVYPEGSALAAWSENCK